MNIYKNEKGGGSDDRASSRVPATTGERALENDMANGKMSSIDSFLSSLPSKVSGAYEEILFRSSAKVTARVLLQLIVAATRPLSLQEVNFEAGTLLFLSDPVFHLCDMHRRFRRGPSYCNVSN